MIFLLIQSIGNLWGFPKGSRKKNEKLQECAKRELLEETNIDIPLKHFVKYIDININEQFARYFYLELSQEFNGKISIKKDINECPNDSTGYTWIKSTCMRSLLSNEKRGIYALNFHCKLILKLLHVIKINIYDKGRVIDINKDNLK